MIATQGMLLELPESRHSKRHRNFFKIAEVIAEMSTCPRLHVGAVIVNPDNHIVCTGYNGSLPGQPHCDEVGCDIVTVTRDGVEVHHCMRTIHAERNAIIQAARIGVSINGCRVYCTHKPCDECAKHLVAAGVSIVPDTQKWMADYVKSTPYRPEPDIVPRVQRCRDGSYQVVWAGSSGVRE